MQYRSASSCLEDQTISFL